MLTFHSILFNLMPSHFLFQSFCLMYFHFSSLFTLLPSPLNLPLFDNPSYHLLFQNSSEDLHSQPFTYSSYELNDPSLCSHSWYGFLFHGIFKLCVLKTGISLFYLPGTVRRIWSVVSKCLLN